eukprot:scaffold15641_cov18-Tisochrysis_lutea.AAC.1
MDDCFSSGADQKSTDNKQNQNLRAVTVMQKKSTKCELQGLPDFHAREKHHIISMAESEVVHSKGANSPRLFLVGGVAHNEAFRYPGMMFHKQMGMVKSCECVTGPFMAFA